MSISKQDKQELELADLQGSIDNIIATQDDIDEAHLDSVIERLDQIDERLDR